MTVEELDPGWVLSFIVFLAALAAGLEIAQMIKKSKEPYWNGKVAGAILGIAALLVILAVFFGNGP